jgi:acyl-CoA:6-aminopenicillanic acid acyl transferase
MSTFIDPAARFIDQSGRAFDRGVAHGQALAGEIRALIDDICPPAWRDDAVIARRLEREVGALERLGGPHQLAEMVGIAVGSDIPFEDIGRLNLIVGADGVPGVDSLEGMYRPACSAIVVDDPEHGVVCGKNGDAEREHERWYWVQRADPRDDGLPRYLNVIWPGTLWTDSGMNEHGLALVQTAGPGMLNQGPGLAGCLLPRLVLERASTVAEAIEVLREVPGSGYGLVYVLADAQGDTAIIEKVHDRTAVRSRKEPYAWAVNRFIAEELQEVIVDIPLDGLDESNSIRCAAFEALGAETPSTRDELIRTLRTPPIHQDGVGDMFSVHTAVYTPQERSLWVARARVTEPFRPYGLDQ